MSILEDLTKQSPEMLEKILQRCRFLLGQNVGTPINLETDEDNAYSWLLEGIQVAVVRKGHVRAPRSVLETRREYKSFLKHCQTVGPWLEALDRDADITHRLHLSIFAATTLVQHVSSFMPVHIFTLLNFYDRVPAAIEESYPGYLESGLLKFVLHVSRGL